MKRLAFLSVLITCIAAQSTRAQEVDHSKMRHETSDTPNASESAHVPPDPPTQLMGDMSYRDMTKMMQMDDRSRVGKIMLDQFEWRSHADAVVWDAEAWYGSDYNKLWLRTEGEHAGGATDARAELFWDRIVSRWWNLQLGARHDFGEGPARSWAAVGVQGIAPYWVHLEATAYVGEEGRTAARVKAEYDLRFTQRLILQPEAEANLYGKSDPERGIGSGLSDLEVGLRLRYEIRREVAPYLGVAWMRRLGGTADLARMQGDDASETSVVAGLRVWF